ncbi:SDR family NAD(P)-dependent oxidoreductase [Flaviflagellibacter deserti]|uniref:SDR family NAD(P)-dependent oxidoreductase n=1 Tax=Flaviflagellibacter deserti TaxID=2267266 RepID=A0ABV9Z0Q0_9HYPH
MGSVEGKVAVITGGNSGIGFAMAERFVRESARVVIVGRRQDAVDHAVAALGDRAAGLVGDVGDPVTHDRVAAFVAERFGKADIYVANAGAITIEPSMAVSAESFDRQFDTNARAAFFGVQAILPHLADGGAILLTSSIATSKLLDGHAVYAATKAAVEAFARAWAVELAPRRIRVNVLSPGPTDTPILGKLGLPADAVPAMEAETAARIPLGRLGEASDLADAALFLASDRAAFITGVNLAVDGGIALT